MRYVQAAVFGQRLLARLQVYEAAARFQIAAEDAVRGFAEGVETPIQEIHRACTQAGVALDSLTQTLLSCQGQDVSQTRIQGFTGK